MRQVVKLSTLEAGDPELSVNVSWHRERENLIRAWGLTWTFLRPTVFLSAALAWAPSIRQAGVFSFPGGDGEVPAVDPADVAAVAAAGLTSEGHAGQAYALTGPQAPQLGAMDGILAAILRKPVRYESNSEQAAAEGMRAAGLPNYVIQGLLGTFGALRAGRLATVSPDVERVTGRPPRTFEARCREHVAAFV